MVLGTIDDAMCSKLVVDMYISLYGRKGNRSQLSFTTPEMLESCAEANYPSKGISFQSSSTL